MNPPVYSSLLAKFLLAAALPLLLLLVFANVAYIYLKTDELRARHLDDVNNEVKLLATQLSIPVWQFDKETVASLVGTLEESDYIVCATLEEYESYSDVVRQLHQVGDCNPEYLKGISSLKNVSSEVTYDYDGELVKTGLLQVNLDLRQVGDSLVASLLSELILFVLYVVIFLVGFTVALKATVLKPLHKVHASILSYQNTGKRELVEWKSKDELGTLIEEYNKNLVGMDEAEQALKDKNDVLVEAKKEAEEARDIAEQTARAKSEFLANMSHEIRTPMNAIQGLAEMLSQTRLNVKQGGYLHRIRNSADILLAIINDILDFSKIEAGKLELEDVEFSLSESIEKIIDVESFVAGNKGIEMIVRVSPDVPDRLKGDAMRFSQVLINLISNAIKFTETGEIVVAIDLEGRSSKQVVIRGTIIDSGVGISDKALATLFDSFTQADGSTTRRFGGTGLGLTICKRLVELMGGEISAKSQMGSGSEFSFTAGFSMPDECEDSFDPLKALGSDIPNVMIVGDSRSCDELFAIFSKIQLDIQRVATGENLINFLQACSTKSTILNPEEQASNPLIIYVDVSNIRVSFSEIAEKLALLNQSLAYRLVPILLPSQRDKIESEDEETRIAGVLTKPILQRRALNSLLAAATMSSEDSDDSLLSTKESNLKGAKILIVEDNQVNQLVAREMLESVGVIVRVADNGEQALNRLEDQFITYDAVLMDIHMPVMDGYSATKAIREKYGDRVPVIALTANATTEEKKRCLSIGMSDFLTKPINSETLFKVLSHWVRISQEGESYAEVNQLLMANNDITEYDMNNKIIAPSNEGNSAQVVETQSDKADSNVTSDMVISLDDLERRFKSHPTIIPRIFQSFKDSFCDFETQFMDAQEASDDETTYRLAHSLKGSASNISADRLRELSADLEEKLKENKQVEAMEWLPWVVDHLSKVLAFIDEYLEKEETK